MNGQCIFTNLIGDIYIGEVKDNLANGQGTKTWSDCVKYVGEWKDDKANGRGVQTYSDERIV